MIPFMREYAPIFLSQILRVEKIQEHFDRARDERLINF